MSQKLVVAVQYLFKVQIGLVIIAIAILAIATGLDGLIAVVPLIGAVALAPVIAITSVVWLINGGQGGTRFFLFSCFGKYSYQFNTFGPVCYP